MIEFIPPSSPGNLALPVGRMRTKLSKELSAPSWIHSLIRIGVSMLYLQKAYLQAFVAEIETNGSLDCVLRIEASDRGYQGRFTNRFFSQRINILFFPRSSVPEKPGFSPTFGRGGEVGGERSQENTFSKRH